MPATARALDLLEEFRDAETALALVVDEYGDIEGLVTLNDLLAAVVGKTRDAADRRRAISRSCSATTAAGWSTAAVAPTICANCSASPQLPNEEDHDFRTAAGMVMAHFGRIPQAGEHFEWRGFRFEVRRSRRRRASTSCWSAAIPKSKWPSTRPAERLWSFVSLRAKVSHYASLVTVRKYFFVSENKCSTASVARGAYDHCVFGNRNTHAKKIFAVFHFAERRKSRLPTSILPNKKVHKIDTRPTDSELGVIHRD